jgi:ABC exporter DevB family membrane fusion protein
MIVAVAAAIWQFVLAGKAGGLGDAGPETMPANSAQATEVQGIGYVEPGSEIRKLMLRTGGVIRRCYVQVGDIVRKDDVLLELEDATPQAEVDVARKQLDLVRAEAEHVNAGVNPYRLKVVEQSIERLREKWRHWQTEAERYRAMHANHSASSQDYEAANTQRRQAEVELKEQEAELLHLEHSVTPENRAMLAAKVRQAEASLALAQERLAETRLRAPFDGTVLKLLKREGEGVRMFEPEPVVLFGDLSRMRVRAEIDERFAQRLAKGQKAVVFGRNLDGREYSGSVAYLERVMGDKTVFTQASSERKDLDVLQVVLDMGPEFQGPAGLQVDVRIAIQP